jgi:hypothetical protein
MVREKDIEDYKNKIEERIESLTKNRDKMIMDIRDTQKELETLAESLYALDTNKIRIMCPQCRSTGIVTAQDGKKHYCEVCGGPDKPYLWADKFTPTPVSQPKLRKEADD